MERQPKAVLSNPPNTGPTLSPAYVEVTEKPKSRPRREGGKALSMTGTFELKIIAPEAPCSALVAMSQPTEGARADAKLASAKRAIPEMRMRRRPVTSAKWPNGTQRTAVTKVKIFTIQVTATAPQLNWLLISLTARFNAEPMKGARKAVTIATESVPFWCPVMRPESGAPAGIPFSSAI